MSLRTADSALWMHLLLGSEILRLCAMRDLRCAWAQFRPCSGPCSCTVRCHA
jgi:hypothetical protein